MARTGVSNRASGAFRPRARQSLHWGVYEICSSALYVGISIVVIAAIVIGVLELIGFGSLTQHYGFNQLIP